MDEGHGRENGEQIHNAGNGEGIADEGPQPAFAKANIGCYPVENVIDDENAHHHRVCNGKYGVVLFEGKRQHAEHHQNKHELVVQARGCGVHLIQFHYVVYLLSNHSCCLCVIGGCVLLLVDAEFAHEVAEVVLSREDSVSQVAGDARPVGKSAIIKEFKFFCDDEGHDVVCEAFFKHDEASDAAVAILKGVDALKTMVEGYDIVERLLFEAVILL